MRRDRGDGNGESDVVMSGIDIPHDGPITGGWSYFS